MNIEDKFKYLINYHLINIDIDMMFIKKINSNQLIEKLLETWKKDPINHL